MKVKCDHRIASHRDRGGHGFESRRSPDFFRLLLSNCLNWKIYCDDHTSLTSECVGKISPSFLHCVKKIRDKISVKAMDTMQENL